MGYFHCLVYIGGGGGAKKPPGLTLALDFRYKTFSSIDSIDSELLTY